MGCLPAQTRDERSAWQRPRRREACLGLRTDQQSHRASLELKAQTERQLRHPHPESPAGFLSRHLLANCQGRRSPPNYRPRGNQHLGARRALTRRRPPTHTLKADHLPRHRRDRTKTVPSHLEMFSGGKSPWCPNPRRGHTTNTSWQNRPAVLPNARNPSKSCLIAHLSSSQAVTSSSLTSFRLPSHQKV